MVVWLAFVTVVSGQAAAPPPFSPQVEANALFLEAREYFNRSDPRVPGGKLKNAREAIKLYEKAIRKDPKFALAYVELSRAWLRLGYSDPDGLPNSEILPPARNALLKAIAIDDKLADAHLALAGLYYSADYDWPNAEREFVRTIQLAPNNAAAHLGYGSYLASMARFDDALREAKNAESIASSIASDLLFARTYYSMRRYDDAAASCRDSLKRGDNVLGHFFLGFVDVAQGKNDEAIAEFKRGTEFSNNGGAWSGLAYGYAMSGKRDEALEIVKDLQSNTKRGLPVPYRLAAVYLALHDTDRAIEWLNKEYEERGNWITQLKVDPVMDPLRSDPRFGELMRRLKFD